MIRTLIGLVLPILLVAGMRAQAGLIVNEVLSNEPGSSTTMEWIELYNDSTSVVYLDDFRLNVNDDTLDMACAVSIEPGEFYVICRRLAGSASFEQRWGDNSGSWGDTPSEDSLATPCEMSFSLTNNSGHVSLVRNGTTVSTLGWTNSGADGYSWERIIADGDGVGQSTAEGGTPGRPNSLSPADIDLAIEDVSVSHNLGKTYLTFDIANRGLYRTDAVNLDVVYIGPLNGSPSGAAGDTLGRVTVRALDPGESIQVTGQYCCSGMYMLCTATLPTDDRAENNSLIFVSVGSDYPPFVLSELMANPPNTLGTEWLEIKCRADVPMEIEGWMFGDANGLHQLSAGSRVIEPDEYIVVADSPVDFLSFYPGFSHLLWQPASWPAFNNDGDIVRLVDPYGIEADLFEYSATFDEYYTWARGEEAGQQDLWGRSEEIYGTPGGFNNVVLSDPGSSITINLDEKYISPDGDGIHDQIVIEIEAPLAPDYTVKIYDRNGRAVRTFQDSDPNPPGTIIWDGLSDAGRRLTIGMYILLVEAGGIASEKTPIVVAR